MCLFLLVVLPFLLLLCVCACVRACVRACVYVCVRARKAFREHCLPTSCKAHHVQDLAHEKIVRSYIVHLDPLVLSHYILAFSSSYILAYEE